MQVDNLFVVKQPLQMFLDKRINIKAMNMLGVRLGCGYFNERFNLCENFHI